MLTMTKSVDKYQELLTELPFIKNVKHIKSAESSVTTSWGAEPWTEEMIKFSQQDLVIPPYKEFTLPDGIAPGGAGFYTGT